MSKPKPKPARKATPHPADVKNRRMRAAMEAMPIAKRPAAQRSRVRPARAKGQSTRDADGLTPLERLFAVEYLVDMNATQAWHRAAPKTSIVACERSGHRALQRPAVQALVKAARDKRMGEAGLSVADVLKKLQQMLMWDPRRLFDEKGNAVPIHQLDDDTVPAISGLEIVEEFQGQGEDRCLVGYTKKYKLLDRNSTLEKAMKYHGLFAVDNKQKADAVGSLLEAIQAQESRLPIKRQK